MSRLRTLLDDRQSVLLMGILNRTPDSFSDGGRFVDEAAAIVQIERLVAEGADIVDVGAESTRPGAPPIAEAEQIARLGGAVREAARRGAIVSIDTTSPVVAEWALGEGATVVNSVALEPARELGALAARFGATLVLMHCRGRMTDMAGFSVYDDTAYGDVVADVAREWRAAANRALGAGLPPSELVLDPGLGYAKNARHSLELCARLHELCALGFPVLAGPSRKSFLVAQGGGAAPANRLGGTIAAALECAARGAAILRVHDVAEVRQALSVSEAIAAVDGGVAESVVRKAQRCSDRSEQPGGSHLGEERHG